MLYAASAHAGNDDGVLVGNDAAVMAGAVTATVVDGSALWYNPAGLAAARVDTVDVSGSAFVLRTYNAKGLLSGSDGSHGDAKVTEIVSVPSALTFVRKLAPGLIAGAGLFVPQYNDLVLRTSLSTHDDANDVTSRWQLAVRDQEAQYRGALGIGWAASQKLSVGFTLFGAYNSSLASFQSAAGYQDQAGQTLVQAVDSSLEEHSLLGTQAALGLILQATRELSIGLSLRSPALAFHQSSRVTSVTASNDVSNPDMPTSEFTPVDETKSESKVGWFEPARVRLGVAYKVGGGSVAIDGDIQPGLNNADFDVDRTFVWNLRAGARFPLKEDLLVGGGLFTDRGSDPKAPSGAGPIHYYGGTVGLQFANVRKLDPSEQHDKLTFATTLALRYAQGHGKTEGINVDTGDSTAVNLDVNEVSLHIGSALLF